MQGHRVTGGEAEWGEEEHTLKVGTAIEMEMRLFRPGLCPLLLHFMKSEVCGNKIPMPLPNPITSKAFNVAASPSSFVSLCTFFSFLVALFCF